MQRSAFDLRQHQRSPSKSIGTIQSLWIPLWMLGIGYVGWGKHPMRTLIVQQPKRLLFEIVLTRHPPRRFPRRLHRRQKKGNQDADNRDHNEQFYQRKPNSSCASRPTKPYL
jgi:hypothetical protein